MKRLELRLAFAWELCLRFSCYGRGVAWLILRVGPGPYVPTCIPERPDFSQLGSSGSPSRQGTCRPSENRRKATRQSHSYPEAGGEKPAGLGCNSHNLRPRAHGYELPPKDDLNFIPRTLY